MIRLRPAARAAAALCALIAFASTAAPASAQYPTTFGPVSGNPADALNALPIEAFHYDPATHCDRNAKKGTPGVRALAAWLGRNARGVSWGSYRCEKWGKNSASLHAEGRALDWHLDIRDARDKREAQRLISLMLAPDASGRPAALARRMGVEEMIWDCRYWSSNPMAAVASIAFKRATCRGSRTEKHRDHIHFGLSIAGAAKHTSWWTRAAPAPQLQDPGLPAGQPAPASQLPAPQAPAPAAAPTVGGLAF